MPSHRLPRRLLLAATFVSLFWILDAALHAVVHSETSQPLVEPSSHQIVDRVLLLVLVLSVTGYCSRLLKTRDLQQAALQEALLNAERERGRLAAIVEAMGDAVSIQDPQLTVLYQNRAHKELIGAHLGERCHLAYRDEPEACRDCHLLESFQDGAVHRAEVSRETLAGKRYYEITASVVKDDCGAITAGIELVRDITDRKLVEQTTRKQAALLQHLIDTIPNPIYYEDYSGRFVWCNQSFASWLSKPRELLIGRTIAQVAPALLSQALKELEPAAEQGAVHELSLQTMDGEAREVLFYKSRFGDYDGERGGVVGVIIDISRRKRAEEEICGLNAALRQQAMELQQVNRELEAFTHAISHDLRTPLTRIYSYGQLLSSYRDVLDENGLVYVNSINEGCLQAEALLNALLDLSRVAEVDLAMTQVDLARLAQEKANELQLDAPERKVEFRIAPQLRAQGDSQLLHIVLDNLIGNAWKYTAKVPNPVIEVGALTSNEGEAVFFVRDNGAGFDASRTDQLFKPFRRLHGSHEFPGTGLGLATVRRIIRRHNGRVWGESSPGCGATFYFTING